MVHGYSGVISAIAAALSSAGYIPLKLDLYLNIENGNIYQYAPVSETLTWVLKGNIKGVEGQGFSIAKTYNSISAMNAGFATDGLPEGAFVIIENGNVNDPDNAKLYVKGAAAYGFITDMSGSQGIKGETGAKGEQGSKGEQGVGISAVTIDGGTNVSDGISYTLTIQKTDNSSVPVTFIAPRGIKGENGADGMAASITIGTVNTGRQAVLLRLQTAARRRKQY